MQSLVKCSRFLLQYPRGRDPHLDADAGTERAVCAVSSPCCCTPPHLRPHPHHHFNLILRALQAKQNVEVLKQTEVIRNVQNILQVGGPWTGGSRPWAGKVCCRCALTALVSASDCLACQHGAACETGAWPAALCLPCVRILPCRPTSACAAAWGTPLCPSSTSYSSTCWRSTSEARPGWTPATHTSASMICHFLSRSRCTAGCRASTS